MGERIDRKIVKYSEREKEKKRMLQREKIR